MRWFGYAVIVGAISTSMNCDNMIRVRDDAAKRTLSVVGGVAMGAYAVEFSLWHVRLGRAILLRFDTS